MIRLDQGLDVRRGRRDADERRKIHTAGESHGFDETGDRNPFAQDDLVAFDDGRHSEGQGNPDDVSSFECRP
jgi:hypothetical protein